MDFDYVVMPVLILLLGLLVIWLSFRRIRSVSTKVSRRWQRVLERIVLSMVVLVAAFLAASSSYNAVALLWFRAHNPPPGQIYTVDGHSMRMDCMGDGVPTILLESGLGDDGLFWGTLQPDLSKTTRVCSYDRAGLGWSDPRPAPRDADRIANQLHGLVLKAQLTGPIVLMGHSVAGLYMRDYVTRFPDGLQGIVFLDSSTPLQDKNPAFKAASASGPPIRMLMELERAAFIVGLPRLMGKCSNLIPGLEPHTRKMQAEDYCHTHLDAVIAEEDGVHSSGLETVGSGPFGAIPILIFSHDPAKVLPQENPQLQRVNVEKAWSQMQEDLKKLSTRSRRIVAKGSSHYVQLDRPDLVEREVTIFIDQIRGTAPQPIAYGTTVTE